MKFFGIAGINRADSADASLRTFKVTVRMTAGLYPSLTNERRWSLEPALADQARRHHLKVRAVLWDRLDEAVITMECRAEDSSAAAETVKSIIRQTAEFTGQITIRDMRVVDISPRTTGGPSIVARDHPPR
jgi:hypothetical protein